MSKQKKALIIAAAAIAVVAIAMAALYFLIRPGTTRETKSFTVEIVHSDGSSKIVNFNADDAYLGDALRVLDLIRGKDGQFGMYITTVDGEDAIYEENGAYWALYVDGEYASQGIDETPIVDGGSYTLVYTLG